jgi:hypothetical protein
MYDVIEISIYESVTLLKIKRALFEREIILMIIETKCLIPLSPQP